MAAIDDFYNSVSLHDPAWDGLDAIPDSADGNPGWDTPESAEDQDDEGDDADDGAIDEMAEDAEPAVEVSVSARSKPHDDVAGPFKDSAKAQQLLNAVEQKGADVLNEVMQSAVSRLVLKPHPLGTSSLLNDAERRRLTDALASAMAAGNLLGQSKTFIRYEQSRDLAEEAALTFAESPTDFSRFDEPASSASGTPSNGGLRWVAGQPPAMALQFFSGLIPKLGRLNANDFNDYFTRAAFTLAVATDKVLLDRVKNVIRERMISGEGINSAPKTIDAILSSAGVSPANKGYSENVFRTNMMDSYQEGTMQAMRDPDVAGYFPVWQYMGIADGRQGLDHEPWFGKFFANGVPFAAVRDYYVVRKGQVVRARPGEGRPFQCRCVPRSVSKYEWTRLQSRGAAITELAA